MDYHIFNYPDTTYSQLKEDYFVGGRTATINGRKLVLDKAMYIIDYNTKAMLNKTEQYDEEGIPNNEAAFSKMIGEKASPYFNFLQDSSPY